MLCSGIQEVVQWMDPDGEYFVWAYLYSAYLGLGVHSLRSPPKVIFQLLNTKVVISINQQAQQDGTYDGWQRFS